MTSGSFNSISTAMSVFAAALLVVAAVFPAVAAPETKYVGIYQVASECDFSVFYDDLSNRLRLVNEDIEVAVTPGLDVASMDSEVVELESRVMLKRGEVQIPQSFVETLKEHLEKRRAARRKKEKAAHEEGKKLRRLVLDPGHGGRFPGACCNGLQEKEINLSVAFKVRDMLEEHGIEVLMTRTRDVELSDDLSTDLDLRCDFTNSKKADIFVSIHANASTDAGATGFDVFVARPEDELERKSVEAAQETPVTGEQLGGKLKPGTAINRIVWRALLKEYYTQSMKLAEMICDGLDTSIDDNNRGVDNKHGFRVIKETRCPAVLVEMGFMSNPVTARKLATASYRKRIARGIAEGILDFKKEFDATRGFTRAKEEPAK